MEQAPSITCGAYGMGRVKTGIPCTPNTRHKPTTRSESGARSTIEDMVTPPPPEDKLDRILAAIESSRISMETKISSIAHDVNILRDDHRKLTEKVKQTEQSITTLKPQVTDNTTQMHDLLDRVRFLEGRAEDAEGRARRSNIRVVGLPEGAEGSNTVQFMEDWLRTFTPLEELSPFFSIERAHRVPSRRPAPGSPSRPLLAKLFHYRDRDAILRAARAKGNLEVEGNHIMIFPDYTLAVQHQRSTFQAVKKRLRDLGLKYSLLFPAKLRVVFNGKAQFFDDPAAAWSWMEERVEGTNPASQNDKDWKPVKNNRKKQLHNTIKTNRQTPMQQPNLEQIIRERKRVLETAASLLQAEQPMISTESITDPSSDPESTYTTESRLEEDDPPKITPQMSHDLG